MDSFLQQNVSGEILVAFNMLQELRPKNVSGKNSTRDRPWYWLNYWHILISKDLSGFLFREDLYDNGTRTVYI